MEHTLIVNANELESYAETRDSEAVIPELVWMLIDQSVPDLTFCRIPYGDLINQPGYDGRVETENGYRQFVPKKKSVWEINTGGDPQDTATKYFKKRTTEISSEERRETWFVFVTPRSSGSRGWNEPQQRKWLDERRGCGWSGIKILDGVQLADWLREYPGIAKWFLKKRGSVKVACGFSTPAEHWEELQLLPGPSDPPLPPKMFLVGRDLACVELDRVFRGKANQLILAEESNLDAADFVAAFLASLDSDTKRAFSARCLFINEPDTWLSMVSLRSAHVLVAHSNLDLDVEGEHLHLAARKKGHGVVFPVSGASASGGDSVIPLRSPSASVLEATLMEGGYSVERARELAAAGALSLAALKRKLRGLGSHPPYAEWGSAYSLAQANILGRWSGENPGDKNAVEKVVGKAYGEWIETVRPETLRSDTPLIQRNENWKILSRGEAWSALGPRLSNEDLDRFQKAAVLVLGERDPRFDLPKEERYLANIKGKVLKYSSSLRKGMAETLALLGSRPNALSSCSQGKAELVAKLTVHELLKDADWVMWASLDSHLPLLAEAAPTEFQDAVEAALSHPTASPFSEVFAQEGSGIVGWNHMTGLLWALETLAWHPDHLMRVTMLLGELAAIDPGGNWANRPANSLTDIFLPWHPQTCATISKRKAAVETLLSEQPVVGWKLLLALLPHMHGVTSGCRKPMWRDFIPVDWSDSIPIAAYWEQVAAYAELAVSVAATDTTKTADLIERLPDLPNQAHSRILDHLGSDAVVGLSESVRLPLWQALVDLAAQHRKFADAQWAMPPQLVARIEEVAAKLAPRSVGLLHRRLFSDREFNLIEEKGDFEAQRQKLDGKRQAAIIEIFDASQISGVLDFTRQVASPWKVGCALGCAAPEAIDAALLPHYLDTAEKSLALMIAGFVWGRFFTKRWPWVDSVLTAAWTTQQRAAFLALLPFVRDTWQRAAQLLGDNEAEYWRKANVDPFGEREHLVEAVEKLLQHRRPQGAVCCLQRLVQEKIGFPPELATRALMAMTTTDEPSKGSDPYAARDVIEWLDDNPAADQNVLCQVEWNYLPLLDRLYDSRPKTLEKRMAAEPRFFCQLIQAVYRSDKKQRSWWKWIKRFCHFTQNVFRFKKAWCTEDQSAEKERNIALNAHRLLHGWEIVPGTSPDGGFDGAAFIKWLEEVKRLCTESGHLSIAMSQVGQVLPHTPPDADGLWIHKSVANAMNAKDATEMRSGFTCKLFNMRGVHSPTGGREEREIAARHRKEAEALEQRGYHRFATAMREFAEQYERDAEREATRDPYED